LRRHQRDGANQYVENDARREAGALSSNDGLTRASGAAGPVDR
jgi:hypothetical protein